MSRSYDWWTRYCFRYLKYVSHDGACVSLNYTGNYEYCSVSWTTCTFNIYGGIPVKDNFSSVYEKNSEIEVYEIKNSYKISPPPPPPPPTNSRIIVCVCLSAGIITHYELFFRGYPGPDGTIDPPETRIFNPAGWYNPRPVLTPLEDPALPPETNFTHTGLDPFTRYQYRVTARNLAGTGQSGYTTVRTAEAGEMHVTFKISRKEFIWWVGKVCGILHKSCIVKVVAINRKTLCGRKLILLYKKNYRWWMFYSSSNRNYI